MKQDTAFLAPLAAKSTVGLAHCAYQRRVKSAMFELLKSLVVAAIMVPVVMAIIMGLIWGMGELCNLISAWGHPEEKES
ncbi:Multidrug efflux pump accessory protein AcrZ [Edwardsiella anguillarum]|nr:Multidrug efflux pump accessory protein AcrZ [Edwardsiella anguillarum]BET84964.1 Multidrug efflux pump accessory protein AcrZ [Edwardsiella anguillarum]BET88329.1 Multidrug efflux pump accessory protein AcrZ [Edwardsiella anguillarum]BET91619.1 Multidrug efflux pump accessory protein AcrZ [Edwardsiella anguillarum]GAJ69232.1 outer membrane or exported [Edwardsiella piscicida]